MFNSRRINPQGSIKLAEPTLKSKKTMSKYLK
jgi:hypothetical protein